MCDHDITIICQGNNNTIVRPRPKRVRRNDTVTWHAVNSDITIEFLDIRIFGEQRIDVGRRDPSRPLTVRPDAPLGQFEFPVICHRSENELENVISNPIIIIEED